MSQKIPKSLNEAENILIEADNFVKKAEQEEIAAVVKEYPTRRALIILS